MGAASDDTIPAYERDVLRVLGQRIRLARLQAGFAQDAAARELGIQPTQLGRIERGEVRFRITTLVHIANRFGVEPHEFLRDLPPDPDA